MYIFILVYTLLLFIGGIIGYLKAQSTASLVMGLLSALVLALLTFAYRRGSQGAGYALLAWVLALGVFFSWRWIQTGSLFPGGFFSLLSTVLLIVIIWHLQSHSK